MEIDIEEKPFTVTFIVYSDKGRSFKDFIGRSNIMWILDGPEGPERQLKVSVLNKTPVIIVTGDIFMKYWRTLLTTIEYPLQEIFIVVDHDIESYINSINNLDDVDSVFDNVRNFYMFETNTIVTVGYGLDDN